MIELISQFLGDETLMEKGVDETRYFHWLYEGAEIKYEIALDLEQKLVSASGDPKFPFGMQSLFEIACPFDRIQIEKEEQFYGSRPILVFRKDYPDKPNFKTLMVMRWDNGELSIWPQSYEVYQLASIK